MRLELRLSAAAYAAPYTDQRLGAKPYTPALPANYRLRQDLKTTASCLEAHQASWQKTLSLDVSQLTPHPLSARNSSCLASLT